MNRYVVGAMLGAALGVIYVVVSTRWTQRPNFEQAFSIFLATLAGVVAAKLFQEVTALKPNDLGKLKHEHNSVILSLAFSMGYAAYSICANFYALGTADSSVSATLKEEPQTWLYHDWGVQDDNCQTPLVLRRGRDNKQLLFLTELKSFPLQIVETPTQNKVVTDEGTFTLQGDGSMRYDQMENKIFTRCDR